MKTYLLGGAALLALLPAAAMAQTTPDSIGVGSAPQPSADGAISEATPQGYGDSSGLDTLAPADGVAADAPAPVASTGDPVADRLNALEAKINQLEARNRQLEDQAAAATDRIEKVEVRAARSVQFSGPGPTFADVGGNFTFKPRGVIQLDYASYNERAGGYDYNTGTDIRRARFGFDGTAFKAFKWRIEAEYVKGTTTLLDAYISYGYKAWLVTVGQQKAPYGLEANTSDSFNTFLERGMANNAFGGVGAERRVGATVAYVSDKINATVGLFGGSESVIRNATTPDEVWSVNGRVTWDPILDTGRVVHLGISAYHAGRLAANAVTVADRPNSRVDDGRLVSAAVSGADKATFIGAEAAVVYGPFSVQGEYGRVSINRIGALPSAKFDGFYAFASFFLTGESRTFKNGTVDRLKPLTDFDPTKGNWGAFEVALRYDQLDLTDRSFSPLDRKGDSWTAALNWYLNGNTKLLFNWIRFKGENSPLVVAPVAINGTTAKGDAFATRLHFDF